MHLLPGRYIFIGMLAFEPDMPITSKCCQIWLLSGFWGRYPGAGTIIGRWGRKPVVQIHYQCLVQSPCHVRFPWDAEPESVTLIGWDKLWVLESDTLIINQADAHRARIMIQIPQLSQYWKFLQSFVVNLSPPARLHDHTLKLVISAQNCVKTWPFGYYTKTNPSDSHHRPFPSCLAA